MQCDAVCCSVMQCVAVCCSVLHSVAVCCSVLQCVAVCCSVFHSKMLEGIRETALLNAPKSAEQSFDLVATQVT